MQSVTGAFPPAANWLCALPNKVLRPGTKTWHVSFFVCCVLGIYKCVVDVSFIHFVSLIFFHFCTSAHWLENVSILVSIQHTQVPLLQGDAVDHDEVVQVVLGRGCSYWDSSSLGNSVR